MRRAAKVDSNHRVIVAAFRAHGCTVQSLAAVGAGVPDLLVGKDGHNRLVEVKDGERVKSERRLTEAQVKWQATWRGNVALVESVDDVVALVRAWRKSLAPVPSDVEVDASDYERPPRMTDAESMMMPREAAASMQRRVDVYTLDATGLRHEVRVTPNVIRSKGGA